jgi:hypothetical protein
MTAAYLRLEPELRIGSGLPGKGSGGACPHVNPATGKAQAVEVPLGGAKGVGAALLNVGSCSGETR